MFHVESGEASVFVAAKKLTRDKDLLQNSRSFELHIFSALLVQ